MFKTIVMATDGSPAVERLIVYTEHMARRTDAQVVVVHAYELPGVYEWTDAYGALSERFRAAAQEVAEDAVDALCRRLRSGEEERDIHCVSLWDIFRVVINNLSPNATT